MSTPGKLLYGDCLTHLRQMPKWSVDLIYGDPPFNSNRDYNSIYKDETGRPLPDMVEAFNDTWTLDAEKERAIRAMPVLMREVGIDDDVANFWRLWMNALRGTNPRLLAYLSYMTERLIHMKSILKPTGSLYLHCDPTASHYLKVLLDGVFDHANFRNEVVWKRTSAHSSARRFGPIHDVLLFYSAGSGYTWNTVYQPYDPEYVRKNYNQKDSRGRFTLDNLTGAGIREGESGKPWGDYDPSAKSRHWAVPRKAHPDLPGAPLQALDELDRIGRIYRPATKGGQPRYKRYLHEMPGVKAQDIILDINSLSRKERLGYATEKPVKLLDRIIRASSNPGDVVLDPFCGCGTTMEAAHRLDRKWIGIDIAIHAIKRVSRVRLEERLGLVKGEHFIIDGVPRDREGAVDLWKRDPYDFQRWAVEEVDGFVTAKRTADGGIDGRLYFGVQGRKDLASMALEVKGGKHVTIAHLRALRGVLETDSAEMAGLIVMHPLKPVQKRNFDRFTAEAGVFEVLDTQYDRMQVLTVDEILAGQRFHTPSVAGLGVTGQGQLPLKQK